MNRSVISYPHVLAKLDPNLTHHLLIGNGFSIGCDSCFSYKSLYESAKDRGLSSRAQEVFTRYGTNNFEAVMKLLDDGNWLAQIYGLTNGESAIAKDLATLKNVLIDSIAKSHPDHTGKVEEKKKRKASTFFDRYHNVFSLNYDLLPYWINMSIKPPRYQDGFREDAENPEAPSLVFSERMGEERGLYFIHGALHLFMGEGGLRKHCWSRTQKPITSLIREGLDRSRYPLFVAEGDPIKKMEQIQSSGYLSYCYGKLGRIKERLVTFGFSFGNSDRHITDAIVENTKITNLFVGLFKSKSYPTEIFDAVENMIQARNKVLSKGRKGAQTKYQLNAVFFDSASAGVWE